MQTLVEVVAIVAPLVTAADFIYRVFHRTALPPERADGVVVEDFKTKTIEHPSARSLSWRRKTAIGRTILFVACCAAGALALVDGSGGLALILVVEGAVLLPAGLLRAIAYRNKKPGDPILSLTLSMLACGGLDDIATRLRRAFLELGALRAAGTTVIQTTSGLVLDGGTGAWSTEGDAGYRVRVTVEGAGERWHVVIDSMNYVPSFIQGYRIRSNAVALARALVA
jgi:hypothetical protein